ncbi:hypothetical protein EGW08_004886 [Elysia chlorotica]|uniref:Uncharacterized protein n=1 Tax=Elysia chlorotica TaxID=188477 RepID=A0A3S1BFW6_ELYCH|nr:hypothetical protein EGW08_004886 [Elysia chlorotica]
MGAAHSKKRRKERKRKRRHQQGGLGLPSARFDVPRSVSVDALRSYGVSASPSAAGGCSHCPHCGGWTWGHEGGTGRGDRDRRTFSGLIESSRVCHGFHRCLRGQYDDMQGAAGAHHATGYDSSDVDNDIDAADWSNHASCPACSLGGSREDLSVACPGPELSTMSLNRHSGLRVNLKLSQSSQSRSAEFSQLLDILSRLEDAKARQLEPGSLSEHGYGKSTVHQMSAPRQVPACTHPPRCNPTSTASLPDQWHRVAVARTPSNTVEAPALVPSNTKSPSPPPTQVMGHAELEQSASLSKAECSTPTDAAATDTTTPHTTTTTTCASSSAAGSTVTTSTATTTCASLSAAGSTATTTTSQPPTATTITQLPTATITQPLTATAITQPSAATTAPTPQLTVTTTTTTTSAPAATTGHAATATSKKTLTVLEDEKTRLARWEKQKLMAEQFRLLRKHLLARDASLNTQRHAVDATEPLPLSLQGPLDAVELYLSSQSTSHSSVKSSDLNSSFSNTSSAQSLPNPSQEDASYVRPGYLSSQSFSSNRPKEALERKAANPTVRSSSFTYSSSTRRKSSTDPDSSSSPLTDNDKTAFDSSQAYQSVDDPASAPQASQGRGKFSRRNQNFRNLDNHPVLSRLQNEQNSRLERMERKMRCIRASAEQAAERKKFEQIFPARQEVLVEDERQRMREAEEALAKLKEETKRKKQMKKLSLKENTASLSESGNVNAALSCVADALEDGKGHDSKAQDESWDVVPVQVLAGRDCSPSSLIGRGRDDNETDTKSEGTQPQDARKKLNWLNSTFSSINMDLGNPVSWLVLPFLLFPLILRLLLSLALNSKPPPTEPTASPANSRREPSDDSSRDATPDQSLVMPRQSSSSEVTKISRSGKCGSKVRLQRVDSSENKMLKST